MVPSLANKRKRRPFWTSCRQRFWLLISTILRFMVQLCLNCHKLSPINGRVLKKSCRNSTTKPQSSYHKDLAVFIGQIQISWADLVKGKVLKHWGLGGELKRFTEVKMTKIYIYTHSYNWLLGPAKASYRADYHWVHMHLISGISCYLCACWSSHLISPIHPSNTRFPIKNDDLLHFLMHAELSRKGEVKP